MKSWALVFLALILPALSPARECRAEKRLTVVYTGNTRGKLRACGCPNDPYGGLAERATLIKDLRKHERPFILVDSGNMVSLYGDYSRKAAAVMKLMNQMRYDAAGIGFNELYYGVEAVSRLEETASFPLLSASVTEKDGTALRTTPSVITKAKDVSVGIISVSDPESNGRMGRPKVDDYRITEPGTAFDEMLADLDTKCDFIIVLSQLTNEKNLTFLAAHPRVDLLVQSWGNDTLDPPDVTADGIIVAPGRGGQQVGIIELEKSPESGVKVLRHEFMAVLDIPEDKHAQEIVREYYMLSK